MANKSIFLDANFLIATHKIDDPMHSKALDLASIIDDNDLTVLSSNYVILETLTILSQRVSRLVATKTGSLLFSKNSPIMLVHVNEEIDTETWKLFRKVKNKNISYVDCSIIATMKNQNTRILATFDKKDFKALQKEYDFEIWPKG